MSILPNISPKTFTLSAVVVGFLLLDDATANEQNAMGNWLMLVAQVLCTNAYYKQVQTERNNVNDMSDHDTLLMLEKMVKSMNEELTNLKNNMKTSK